VSTRTAQAGTFPRRLLAIAAVAAIALSLALAARAPVLAADTKVDIHQTLPIASSTFSEDGDCGEFTSGVVWHFILNHYDPNDAQLFVTFADSGSQGPISETDHPSTSHHFYVNTPDDDSLTDAYVMLPGAPGDAQLQLSHVCHTDVEHSVAESASAPESASESESASGDESVAGSASGEESFKAGEGTPEESVTDGAFFGAGSGPLPTILFSLILLASLGTLAYANVKTVYGRS
jgi:hypothetical protein